MINTDEHSFKIGGQLANGVRNTVFLEEVLKKEKVLRIVSREREIEEELEYKGFEFELFKRYSHTNSRLGIIVERNVYLSEVDDVVDLSSRLTCHEGAMAVMSLKALPELRMLPGFEELSKEIYDYLTVERKIV